MHVVVVGAGIVGVTIAYFLTRAGMRVTVFARTDKEVAVIAHQGTDLMELGERILPLMSAGYLAAKRRMVLG